MSECNSQSETCPSQIKNNSSESPSLKSDTQIKINEFLEFLKISCHVNELISKRKLFDKASDQKPNNEKDLEINLSKLAANEMIKTLYNFEKQNESITQDESYIKNIPSKEPLNERHKLQQSLSVGFLGCAETSRTSLKAPVTSNEIHPKLNEKLEEIIDEGILDSVLPFVCSVNAVPPIPLKGSTNKSRADSIERISCETTNTQLVGPFIDSTSVTMETAQGVESTGFVSTVQSNRSTKTKEGKPSAKRRKSFLKSCPKPATAVTSKQTE